MNDINLDELKERGAGLAAPPEVSSLYKRAFAEFGPLALWNRKASDNPTIGQALVIADSLKREGNMKSWQLAVAIEQAYLAAL